MSRSRDDFLVGYCSGSGECFDEQPLAALVARVDVRDLSPVRFPSSYKAQSHLPGYYWFSRMQGLIAYESRLEMATLMVLDADPRVTQVLAQPFTIHYFNDGRWCKHTPDFLVWHRPQNKVTVINVKPQKYTETPANIQKFSSCDAFCALSGWQYSTRSEPHPVLFANLSYLSAYRRDIPLVDRFGPEIIAIASEPVSIKRLIDAITAPPCRVKPVLFHLIWKGILTVDLFERMSPHTMVTVSSRLEVLWR